MYFVPTNRRRYKMWLCYFFIALTMKAQYIHTWTIDEIIKNASTPQSSVSDIPGLTSAMMASASSHDMPVSESNQLYRLEMDMMLTAKQTSTLLQAWRDEKLNKSRKKRKAWRLTNRWSNNEIPYEFDAPGQFTRGDKRVIRKAMKEWEKYTCLRFRPARSSDTAKVEFIYGMGCYSNVGMLRDRKTSTQTISLGKNCLHVETVLHELGHTIGMMHEHSRPDRDGYITINYQNVHKNGIDQFTKYPHSFINTYSVPYDYTSIMHYGQMAFSINDQPTIITHDPAYQDIIGNVKTLSFNDIKLANLMYNCGDTSKCSNKPRCPPGGYMDKNCVCQCQGDPIKPCNQPQTTTTQQTYPPTGLSSHETTITAISTTTSGLCLDTGYLDCTVWKMMGLCYTSITVQEQCRKTCSLCPTQEPTTTTAGPTWLSTWIWYYRRSARSPARDGCEDKRPDCNFLKQNGFCSHNSNEWILITRTYCSRMVHQKPCFCMQQGSNSSYCRDKNSRCLYRRDTGYCTMFLSVAGNCRKSCRLC